MKDISTVELIAKLWIWHKENVPQNELIKLAIDRLESMNIKIEELEEKIDYLLTNEMP